MLLYNTVPLYEIRVNTMNVTILQYYVTHLALFILINTLVIF